MKILIIGGSYFLGRVFTMLSAKENEVTVLNRGTYSMEEFGALSLKADRHDEAALRSLLTDPFDVVVDFCAYRQGDIRRILDSLPVPPKQYIFISTADVYRKWTQEVLTESAPLDNRHFGGENGEYIWQKILLEQELQLACAEKNTAFISVRPAVLYGPFNYAMREAGYVQLACAGREILCPIGAKGRFQPVYVKDAAAMLLALCGNELAKNSVYNLAGEPVDYERFLDAFAAASGGKMRLCKLPAQDPVFQEPNVFLPFPFTEEETERYEGKKILKDTGLSWTPLEEGLRKTWQIFSKLYG